MQTRDGKNSGGKFQICVDVCAYVLLYRLQVFKALDISHINPGFPFLSERTGTPLPTQQ